MGFVCDVRWSGLEFVSLSKHAPHCTQLGLCIHVNVAALLQFMAYK